jgi:hypothetical protein
VDPDPGSGAFLPPPPPRIRDWVTKFDEGMDEQPGSNISESLETIFRVKILKILLCGPAL